jgi:hypothetical protein
VKGVDAEPHVLRRQPDVLGVGGIVGRPEAERRAAVGHPPPPVATVAVLGVVFDEAEVGQDPQVVAGGAARLPDAAAELGRGGRAVGLEQVQQADADRIDQSPQPPRGEYEVTRRVDERRPATGWRCRHRRGAILGHTPQPKLQR